VSQALPIVPAEVPPCEARANLQLDPRTYDRALTCVHCGLCLPACPTYLLTGHEAESPRGRIQLMRGLADGRIGLTETVREHLDLCLDCRGCETACPSGVIYHELIEEARAKLREAGIEEGGGRIMRWLLFYVFTRPGRLRAALLPVRILRAIRVYGILRKIGVMKLLPGPLRRMERMLPANGCFWPGKLPEFVAATGILSSRRGATPRANARVGFFAGCVGSVLFGRVNEQAIDLLAESGADVVIPPTQECCGAIHHHNGRWDTARELARRNIDAFLPENGPEVDYITTTIAGCGAMLREYNHLLRDDPLYANRAKEFARRVRDVSEVFVDLGLPPMRYAVEATATYHDACHLLHAQGVGVPPRKLLASVEGLKLVPLVDSEVCGGAAGTYSLLHPKMSAKLVEAKLKHIAATGAQLCIAGNVGCAMQIAAGARAAGMKLRVVHPVQILHEAAFGAGR